MSTLRTRSVTAAAAVEHPGQRHHDRDARRLLEVADRVVEAHGHVPQPDAVVRRRQRLAVVGRHDDERRLREPERLDLREQHADGRVVLRALGHVRSAPRGSSATPAGAVGDAREDLRDRVVRLVRRVEVDEEEEPFVVVRVEPGERVLRDLAGVARPVAVVGEALEAHVDADGRVAAT